LWQFPAQAAVIAAPITYRAAGRQYVTVLVGMGTSAGVSGQPLGDITIDYRTQRKRVLSFVLDGKAALPDPGIDVPQPPPDPGYAADPQLAAAGSAIYHQHCFFCHGVAADSGGTAPDLRLSSAPESPEAFESVVKNGALRANGMPGFDELSKADLDSLRQYLRTATFEFRQRRGR
jgi:quinohemoprotein ethanol dehydrogenase